MARVMMEEAETCETITVADETYPVRLILAEDFADLRRWRQLENWGRWTATGSSLVGEWLRDSPSLFLKEKISGDYLWRITVTRLPPNAEFLERFRASKWGREADPLHKYNFNFWLRAAAPSDGEFFAEYPQKLGTSWNGMGDDYWHSCFTTVVWDGEENWVRLRHSPGYEKVEDVRGVVPHLPYNEPHVFTFVIRHNRIRAYFDEQIIYDHADPGVYESGYLGLCVWLSVIRFSNMRMYRFV